MDATTKERADRDVVTPLNIVEPDRMSGPLAQRQALVAELIVKSGHHYEAGGRGINGSGLDGFGFLRLAVMAATGRQVADLFGYPGWPQAEPPESRVANMIDDWGMTQVGDYRLRDYRPGDVIVSMGRGPAAEIVVSPGNQDRRALVAGCWAPERPSVRLNEPRSQRHQCRVYRWVEA